jgi:hypothetical protein
MMEDERITQEWLIENFGDSMPIEAVNLIYDSPGNKTLGEVRAELRAMAANRPKPTLDIRERIAREVMRFQWDSATDISDAEEVADRILAISEIAEALRLVAASAEFSKLYATALEGDQAVPLNLGHSISTQRD